MSYHLNLCVCMVATTRVHREEKGSWEAGSPPCVYVPSFLPVKRKTKVAKFVVCEAEGLGIIACLLWMKWSELSIYSRRGGKCF